MRLAIIGSRNFNDYQIFTRILNQLRNVEDITSIISGGAKGADTLAEKYALDNNIPITIFPADWNTHGKKAGYIRNVTIWDNSDLGIAFWDGSSKGTEHSFKLAKTQNKILYIYEYLKDRLYFNDLC